MNHLGRVFRAGTQRRSVPNFQKAVRISTGKLGKLHTMYASIYCPATTSTGCRPSRILRETRWIGTSGWGLPRGGPTTMTYCTEMAGAVGFRFRGPVARLGRTHGQFCQWANKADDTMPIEYEPSPRRRSLPLRQWRETGPGFLPDPV